MRVPAFALLGVSLTIASTNLYAQSSFVSHSSGSASSLTASVPAAAPTTKKDEAKVKEIIPPKLKAAIEDGTLTVDGMIAKARLNYNINDSYIYFFVPDVGAVIVAQANFPGATLQEKAFQANTLTVQADGHEIQLSSNANFAVKKGGDAYVWVDPSFRTSSRFPMMGYGDTRNAPYIWPGSKFQMPSEVQTGAVKPPPIPKNLMPKMEVAAGYTVTVKADGQ